MNTPRTASTKPALAAALLLGLASHANAAGWQGRNVQSIPPGTTDFFFHYACPAGAPVAVSGGFLPNLQAKAGMVVLGNGPRLDLDPPFYGEWSWIIDWPTGAPAGAQIKFDVNCKKS